MADEKSKEKSGISVPFMIGYTALITIIVCAVAFGVGYKVIFRKPADLTAKTDIKAIAKDPESEAALDLYKKLTIEANSSVKDAATVRIPIDKLLFNLTPDDPKKKGATLVATLEIVLLDYYTLMKLNDISANPKNAKNWKKIEDEKTKREKESAKGRTEEITKEQGGAAAPTEPAVLRVKVVFDKQEGVLFNYINHFIPTYTGTQVMTSETKSEITEKIKEKINEILEENSKGLGTCSEVNIIKWMVA